MKKYRLVAADLDGTLLDKKGEIGSDTVAAIRELHEKGVECVIATGRAYNEIPEVLRDCPYVRYIIFSNGAVLFDRKEDRKIVTYIPNPTVRKMMDIINDYEIQNTVHIGSVSYYEKREPLEKVKDYYRISPLYVKNVGKNAVPIENFDAFIRSSDEVEVFSLYFHDDTELKECAERLRDLGDLYITFTAHANFEVFDTMSGKDKGLMRLAEYTGIPLEEMITVGDSENDLAMTKISGLGLAVKDASPVLLSAADGTVSEGGDGVMRDILTKYFS